MAEYRKKLIEVALPLDAINAESAREKSIRHGHPSTLHLWWARRPLAACRAVLFSSLVDDPAEPAAPLAYITALDALPKPEPLPLLWDGMTEAEHRRERLFAFIARLVKWEASNDEHILATARELINLACEGNPPPVLDPFCGGGSIPLEAQRLGLEAHASDLNPVAVLITKALIEIPPKFANRPPVNPDSRTNRLPLSASERGPGGEVWRGAAGLAADVRYYGRWMRDEAERRIGHLYPKAKLPDGSEATVIAWLWARTVRCPNPACGARMPLVRSFALSTKPGKQAWVEPVVDQAAKTVRFEVKTGTGKPPDGTKQRGKSFCLFCGSTLSDAMLREQASRYGMDAQLMAVVAEGARGRIYLGADAVPEVQVQAPEVPWLEQPMPDNPRWFSPPGYGLPNFGDLFTPRQLIALTTFSDLVGEARERVHHDAVVAGLLKDGVPLAEGGTGAQAYADAVAVYLSFGVSKATSRNCTLAIWETGMDRLAGAFGRQAVPMTWDYAETNPIAGAGGDIAGTVDSVREVLDKLPIGATGKTVQSEAASFDLNQMLIATDPPYYDNIGYSDLSDFFYVWLRRSLHDIISGLFGTLLTPKSPELIATPYRFGGDKRKAEQFFEQGLGKAFARIRDAQRPDFPLTVYYAFKQAESERRDSEGARTSNANSSSAVSEVSTGWETMLQGLLSAGFQITGTWPVRSELIGSLKKGVNALASSIVIVCRPRTANALEQGRREFLEELGRAMSNALPLLASGQVVPVDLAQASIGPGMAVYSRYRQVIRQDGRPVTVREALIDINNAIASYRTERVRTFDGETRFCVDWYTQYGYTDGQYGDALTLARAYNVVPQSMDDDGLLVAQRGKVALEHPSTYPVGVAGLAERGFHGSAWEACLRLAQTLSKEGEQAAAALVHELGEGIAARARELAVWLYTIADTRKRADDAFLFNTLDASWSGIQQHVARMSEGRQGRF